MNQPTSELRELARVIGKALLQFANEPSRNKNTSPIPARVEEYTTKPVAAPEPGTRASADAEWLRVNDVKRHFGLSRSTLYQLINEGAIKSVCLRRRGNVKGVRLIHRESVAKWIDGHSA